MSSGWEELVEEHAAAEREALAAAVAYVRGECGEDRLRRAVGTYEETGRALRAVGPAAR